MYDDLVKRLRLISKSHGEFIDLYGEAADAIEGLRKAVLRLENESGIYDELPTVYIYPTKWIPVTERLPESGIHVLACCRVKWLNGNGRSYVCDAFYSAPKTEVCSYNDDIDAEYDEETDEYYMPEGWWEVIKNWDDYSCVAIADFVTHWMPLPEPLQEET